MASEGPTTTGSIDAKLTIDKSEWDKKSEEAKAEAKELGSLDPTIKVDANVSEAVAKLDSVRVAEQRVETATRQAANTASTAYIAHERLTAIMEKRGRTDLQVAAATEASARADRNAEASEIRLLAATEALNKAKAEEARKSLEQAAANEVASKSADNATSSQSGYTSALSVFIALAPALLGPVAALSAAATGLGVAFGNMAVSGIAALAGIKNEMDAGTTAGNAYSAGLGTLKGDLSELGSTSANAMLGAFNDVVSDVNVKMPFLNQLLHDGAAELGHMGGTALQGVLDGLQQMNPLIQFGAVQLEKFVTWLFSFNGTNGFTQFIQYAMDNLPATMQLIENLVTLAGHILAAYAPLGPVVLGFLNGLTDVLNGLPLPVLAGLVTTATTIAPAFGLARTAVSLFGVASEVAGGEVAFLGISANLAIPIVGILTAVIAGVGIAMATSALGTDKNTTALNSYTQALKDDNDVLGQHVRLQAAKALSDAGAFDAARTLGVSQTVLTDALMGVAGAQDIVNDAVKKGKAFQEDNTQNVISATSHAVVQSEAQRKMGSAIDVVTGALNTQSGAIAQSKQQNEDIKAATDSTTGAMSAQAIAIQGQASMFGVSTSMYQQAMDAQDKAKVSTEQQTVAMQLQNDAAGLLKMAWDELNGKTVTAAQAQNAFDSSLANMGDHIDKTGKKVHFTTTSITDMSAASVALRGQLIGQVTGMEKVIEANGGLENATDSAKQKYADMRQQIIDNAVAHGVDKDAVEKYIDSIYKVPVSKGTKIEVEKTQAEADLAAFQARVDAVHGKTIDLITRESTQRTADTMGTRTNPVTGEQETYVSTPGGAEAPGSGTGTATKGTFLGYAHGGSVAYLASGGHPGGPRGSDTVPAWLTPEEFVFKRASAKSIGLPAMNYMNQTGQLPPSGGQQGPMVMTGTLVMDSGEVLGVFTGIARAEAASAVSAANRDASRRPSR